MNKSLKTVLLLTILVVPALIFIFLKMFGANQYNVPVYFENGVDTTFTDCVFETGPHFIPDFSIPDHMGREINDDYFAGAFLVVYFTQDVTDVASHRINNGLARVLGTFEHLGHVRVLTIQPQIAGNTVEQLRQMADKYSQDENTWAFGYANPVYTNQLARCGFVVDFDAMGNEINNTVVLADEKGRVRGYFNGLDDDEIERLIVELKILNSNRK